MPCFHPWEPAPQMGLRPGLMLTCSQCIGCRLRRSAEWATRCIHESKSQPYNAWLTLTYDDEHLPSRYWTGATNPRTGKKIYSGTLHKEHPQKFLRALRKALGREGRRAARGQHPSILHADMGLRPMPLLKLRYYYGGEYGEKYGRPHYHLCLFGIDLADKKFNNTTDQDFKLYTSETITKLWTHGTHLIGELTWETAAYTARYIMKKITGKKQEKHYEKLDHDTGEIIKTIPEYNDMSRRPGVGQFWIDKYIKDVYPHDYVIVRGNKTRPPRYYDKRYEKLMPSEYQSLKFGRTIEALQHKEKHTPERLKAEEIITARRTQSLKQKL